MVENAFQSRKLARDFAYKLIFEYIFNRDDVSMIDPAVKDTMLQAPELKQKDIDYINNVVDGVKDKYDELTSLISKYAKNFKIERIFKPDLAALLLATYEMKYCEDIPPKVSISEAIEIVGEYSTDKSKSFVNGVLAGIYKEIFGVC